MVFDRVLTDAEISVVVLAGVARDHEVHDLMPSQHQRGDVGGCSPSQASMFSIVRLVQRPLEARSEQLRSGLQAR